MFDPLIQKAEAVPVPVKDLYLVAVPIMKYEHGVIKLTELKTLLNN